MAEVREGIYLEENRPRKTQFRNRRAAIRPVIVLHTAESGTSPSYPDNKAEGVAGFISRRTTYGSYHLVGDKDSIIQLVQFSKAAFGDGTGSNEFAIHISLAMNAADWSKLSTSDRNAYLDTMVQMAVIAAHWLRDNGYGTPENVELSQYRSGRSNANGFITHGKRDPGRRSDPGPDFPMEEFLRRYEAAVTGNPTTPVDPNTSNLKDLQKLLGVPETDKVDSATRAALKGRWIGLRSDFGSEVAGQLENDQGLVEWVQTRLNQRYGHELKPDGVYGPLSKAAAVQSLGKAGGIIDSGLYLWLSSEDQ